MPAEACSAGVRNACSWCVQITGVANADAVCSEALTPPGSAATGCEWSEASAYAAAAALAETHSTTAAAAFDLYCAPRCAAAAGGANWDFAAPEATLLIMTAAYAAASRGACAAGAPLPPAAVRACAVRAQI